MIQFKHLTHSQFKNRYPDVLECLNDNNSLELGEISLPWHRKPQMACIIVGGVPVRYFIPGFGWYLSPRSVSFVETSANEE